LLGYSVTIYVETAVVVDRPVFTAVVKDLLAAAQFIFIALIILIVVDILAVVVNLIAVWIVVVVKVAVASETTRRFLFAAFPVAFL
jgi:hypothetical protein